MDASTHIKRLAAALAASWLCGIGGCEPGLVAPDEPQRPASCPETRKVPPPMPGVRPEHRTAEYWVTRQAQYGPVDEPLMSAAATARHNEALRQPIDGEPIGQVGLLADIEPTMLRTQLEERLAYMRGRLESKELADEHGELVSSDVLEAFAVPSALDAMKEWRAAEGLVPLRCGPHDRGFYHLPVDVEFDRNRCSTLREGELVQLLARWPNGMFLARTPYALGWVDGSDLSTPLSRANVAARLQSRRAQAVTRRAVVTEAFSMLGAPYGWGGRGGGYDCSRFLLELFARFGIELPRHSARQAMAGTFSVDVSMVEELNEKELVIEAAARRGIVLLQFPGHIMLYLGTTEDGVPMAIHAFSEFLTPCDGTELETVNRVDRVAVSDLTLGDGSSRTDFLSRVTRVTVLGGTPGRGLVADAELRRAAPVALPESRCADSKRTTIFRSPLRPDASRPLRVIAASESDPGAASLTLFTPDGTPVEPEQQVLDGPPFSRWVEVAQPTPGRWTAVFGDGDQILACERIGVAAQPAAAARRNAPGPAWNVSSQWGRTSENLYSVFIEQLFREPTGDDTTWPSLQALIGDSKRNLLYDYREIGEDEALALEPDCADLPYFLRAYFSWKLRLPFVYRMCTRGRKNSAPTCDPFVLSNLDSVPDKTSAAAFRRFVRRVANTVHSSSPRTLPHDDETDFYPVRLSRQSIRPGTVYADPYGHVLVVARWQPQGVSDYGVLIGADAQPDGTVGRRRFWRGSFLFTPDTERVGAGFKAWRPVQYDPSPSADVQEDPIEVADAGASGNADPSGDETVADPPPPPPQVWGIPTNAQLREAKGIRAWSDAQYRGSADDFYSTMEGIINPRPLDPVRMQVSLVDALEESVQRRVSSVQNGEDFMREQSYAVVDMPFGAGLFLTTGPWEDFSTPSRDMRLLISIDAVLSLAGSVEAHPRRFGISEADESAAVEQVRAALQSELENRSFDYTRSDGSEWTLALADVVERAKALEVAYNPNDCVELRWGAPEGSEERATCKRRAPEDQTNRMQKYRAWFAMRKRPE